MVLCVLLFTGRASASSLDLSPSDYSKISTRIWKNECGGTVDGLTSWNSGEDFASLGIGHFIWYPAGKRGPFEESFPKLISFLKSQGADVPGWILPACPWKTRKEFLADFDSPRMRSLRQFLSATVPLQGRFLAERLERALPKMLETVSASEGNRIRANFYRVAAAPLGAYALIDYVNFKGEGTLSTERYAGKGWGLLQVLGGMENGPALDAFSRSAARILQIRVRNSPPARREKRWLPGWLNRVASYRSCP